MAMKIKSVVIISIFSIITLLLIYSYKHLCYYSEMKYGSNIEHIDIKVSGLKFDILHYIIDKDSHLILSEEMSGISLRQPGGDIFSSHCTHINQQLMVSPKGHSSH